MEPVELPIEDWIDLHTFQPREIPSLVEEYIYQAVRKGFKHVRIIHGKGTGNLRRTVHALLARLDFVTAYRLAGEDGGGWGATLVALKPLERSS